MFPDRPRITQLTLDVGIVFQCGAGTGIVNVGAGAGSYEPTDRAVVAVEPSRTMIEQRPAGAAPSWEFPGCRSSLDPISP